MRRLYTALLILLSTPLLLSAHPHVFIDLTASYDRDHNRLQLVWTIDEMSSQIIAMDYDTNRNGCFEANEAEAFLGEEGYAMLFRRGDFFLHPKSRIENLKVSLADNRVNVIFDVIPASDTLGIWDEEYLFAFQIVKSSDIAAVEEDDDYYGYRLKLR
jgi:ABC-type uncharacterized transport system substrate-binding protein